MNKVLSSFLVLSCILRPAMGSEYHVATNGVDSNPGTFGAPFATVEHAVSQLSGGDTLHLRGGRYQQQALIDGLGSPLMRGTGWDGRWLFDNGAQYADTVEHAGSNSMRLRSKATARRKLSLPVSGGTLSFTWDADSLDNANEYAQVEVFDGSWHLVWSTNNAGNGADTVDLPDALLTEVVSLAGYGTVSEIRFSLTSNTGGADYFFFDDIIIGAAQDDFDAEFQPITIKNYNNEKVTLDGSVEIDSIASGGWTHYRDGIYQRSVTQDVWQLFLDDVMVYPGRWPDANFEDGSLWSREGSMLPWSYGTSNGNGTATFAALTNFPAAQRADFLEGVAILNHHHWLTAAMKMESIDWSTGTIGLDGTLELKDQLMGYVYGLGCIDRDNEWWFDADTQTIYYRAPGAVDPSTLPSTLRGRVTDYALTVGNSENVRVQGLDFFSASVAVKADCDGVEIDSCHFLYPNEYKFMLGITQQVYSDTYTDPLVASNSTCFVIQGSNCVLENSVFEYSNTHIVLSGSDMRVENNLFHDIEWDVVSSGASGTFNLGERMRFLRNRAFRCGNSEGARPLSQRHDSEVAYNHLSQMSLLQVDGAAINCSLHSHRNHVHHNWVHDSKRAAIRWDWWPDPVNSEAHGGCFHHNVTWNCPIWQIKNDHNVLFNNVGTLNASVYFYDYAGGTNDYSVAVNNLTQKMFQHGAVLRDNHTELGFEFDLLRDWEQFDFRPASGVNPLVDAGSDLLLSEIPGLATYNIPVPNDGTKADISTVGSAPDIGAYEFGSAEYWIPGRKTAQASMPIPADGGTTDPVGRDLIYLIGYEGVSANILLGTSSNSMSLFSSQSDPTNVVDLATLNGKTTYFWRVDTVLADSSVVTGEVWSFTTTALPPATASQPVPADGADKQSLETDLSWLIGLDGVGAAVYFGTNVSTLGFLDAVNDPTNGVELATLDENTTYYWRVDTMLEDTSVVTGEVWSFTTGEGPSISVSASTPTNDVVEFYDDPGNGVMGCSRKPSGTYTNRSAGQVFTLTTQTSIDIDGITLQTGRDIDFGSDGVPHTFLVALMKDTDGNGKTDLQLGDIYAFDMAGQDWAGVDDYLTFHFGVPITGLESGTYSFHTWFGEVQAGNDFLFRRHVGTGTYAEGGQISRSNPAEFPVANLTPSTTGNDFIFYIHGTEASTNTFDYWIDQYGLSAAQSEPSVDIEPDGLDNLLEYALGGNPTNDDAALVLPIFQGSTVLEYIYRRREDFVERGLDYTVEVSTNLVSNVWNTNGVVVAGTSLPIDGFESVTNHVSSEDAPHKFIQLEITENE